MRITINPDDRLLTQAQRITGMRERPQRTDGWGWATSGGKVAQLPASAKALLRDAMFTFGSPP